MMASLLRKRCGDRDDAYDAGGYSHADVKTYIRHKMTKSEVANLYRSNTSRDGKFVS